MDAALTEKDDAADGPWMLPTGWVLATLSELIGPDGLMVDGDWVESKDQDPKGKVRLIQLADIGEGQFLDKSNRFLTDENAQRLRCTFLQENDVLVARMASPLGRACIYPGLSQPAVTVVDVCIWRSNLLIEPRWIVNAISSLQCRKAIIADASGTTRQRVSGGKLKNITLPVPPFAEQRRIAARVDALFVEIAEGEAALAEARKGLDTFRRALLKAAVTGELTKDWRASNPVSETGHDLLARIAKKSAAKSPAKGRGRDADSQPLDSSSLTELPEGWAWATAAELFKWSSGDFLPTSQMEAGPIPVYGGNGIAGTHSRHNVLTPTIIVGRVGFYCGAIHVSNGPTWITDNAIFAKEWPTLCELGFLSVVLEQSNLRQRGQGGAQPFINQKILNETVLPIPPALEQVEILRRVSDALAAVADTLAVLDAEAADAARLKQSILKAAFEGRLVPQEPGDEPASALLARMKATPSTAPARRGRTRQGR